MTKSSNMIYKLLVVGVIVLFIGVTVAPSISGYNRKTNIQSVKEVPISFPSQDGLLAYWKSDECDGTTLWDCSGHNYNGIIYADWNPGGCLNFDGIDDYVDFDNHSGNLGYNKTDDYIISFNFKSTSSSTGTIYGMSHTDTVRAFAYLDLNTNGTLSYKTGDENCLFELYTAGTYNDGEWHYVEVKFYGDIVYPTLEIWVDGTKDGSITDWLFPILSEDFETAKMGRRSAEDINYFDGTIDDVRIYKWPGGGPPSPPDIKGPTKGNVNTKYDFTFTSIDPVGQDLSYYIDWGDGNTTGWSTPQVSGTPFPANHTWITQNKFVIKAKARNAVGTESTVAEHIITIPRNKASSYPWYHWFIECFPFLEVLLRTINLLRYV